MEETFSQGLIQVYTGDGKGKTTAALGQAFRAMGHGLSVAVVQFLKGKDEPGEVLMSKRLEPQIRFFRFGSGQFIINREPTAKELELAAQGLETVRHIFQSNEFQMVILDEISHAIRTKVLTEGAVLSLLDEKPEGVELILTGRSFPEGILDRAQLISEINAVRHPFELGIQARQGIEF